MTYQIKFKANKFKAKKKEYMGVWYDSMLEASQAETLDWRIKAGEVTEWKRQVRLDLKVNGVHLCNYFIDFVATLKGGSREFIEVKGFATSTWQLKWKILEATREDHLQPNDELIVIKK